MTLPILGVKHDLNWIIAQALVLMFTFLSDPQVAPSIMQ